MGQFREITPEEEERIAAEKKQKEEEEEKKAQSIKVGDRCEVNNPKVPPVKRGTVMYVGKLMMYRGRYMRFISVNSVDLKLVTMNIDLKAASCYVL